jgi:uncharacterized protein YaaN involved in tellurite resistance
MEKNDKITKTVENQIFKLDSSENLDLSKYSEEDVQKSKQIAEQLNHNDVNSILNFGVELQSKLNTYSNDVLNNIRATDTGEIGSLITDLLDEINYIDIDKYDQNLFQRLLNNVPILKNIVRHTKKLISKYDKVSNNIDNITSKLDKGRLILYKDNESLEHIFEKNLEFINDIKYHILAGEIKIDELQKEIDEIERNPDEIDYELSDKKSYLDRLKKKVSDLKITKIVTFQSLPQIRIIQNNNSIIIEKIQSSITNTIPLWKNQIAIAVTLDKQKNAIEIQKNLYDTTNKILQKNSELLKTNSIDVAKQNEESIVNINTLKKVNTDLISTLNEILKIKEEGEIKRKSLNSDLIKIEDELKTKILDTKMKINNDIV